MYRLHALALGSLTLLSTLGIVLLLLLGAAALLATVAAVSAADRIGWVSAHWRKKRARRAASVTRAVPRTRNPSKSVYAPWRR